MADRKKTKTSSSSLEKILKPSEVLKGSTGTWYKDDRGIEPLQYIEANHLTFHEGNIVKYITRWRKKDGIKDLHKVKFYISRMIELVEAGVDV